MRVNPFRPVEIRYGAPMGRVGGRKAIDPTKRICARWGYGCEGYDSGGAYWGTPQNIWAVWNAGDHETIKYIRASDRADALKQALKTTEDNT